MDSLSGDVRGFLLCVCHLLLQMGGLEQWEGVGDNSKHVQDLVCGP